jgi:hypothetical protein
MGRTYGTYGKKKNADGNLVENLKNSAHLGGLGV